jgi:CubicO group peptidase (beta-lactamase class C family)
MFGADPDPIFATSYAAVVVHHGRIVAERYANDTTVDTPRWSWSMAKSVTHALVGILVGDGRLDPHARAPVPEWDDPADPRHGITLHQLLRMVDGLEFNEDYEIPDDPDADVPISHCIDMLYGTGVDDHAAYAAARPPAHPPDTVFNYSSGTSHIVARIVCDRIGRGQEAEAWMRDHLFDPIGMTTASPTFDTAGNFVGSSYLEATARDFARFGLLHLRGGEWEGTRVVPAEWVDDGRTMRAIDESNGRPYGAHWWGVDDGRGTFWASGFEGQRIMCVPQNDMVLVRLGRSPGDDAGNALLAWSDDLIAAFDPA